MINNLYSLTSDFLLESFAWRTLYWILMVSLKQFEVFVPLVLILKFIVPRLERIFKAFDPLKIPSYISLIAEYDIQRISAVLAILRGIYSCQSEVVYSTMLSQFAFLHRCFCFPCIYQNVILCKCHVQWY